MIAEDSLSLWYFERDGVNTCGERIYEVIDGPEWASISADVLTIISASQEDEPASSFVTLTVTLALYESESSQF